MKAKDLLILNRYFQNDICTLGTFRMNSDHQPIFTLELPWKNNQKFISCIPAGIYTLAPYSGSKHKYVYKFYGVEPREHVEFHVGNYIKDTGGCPLVGLGINPSAPMLINSVRAMDVVRDQLGSREWKIQVINQWG